MLEINESQFEKEVNQSDSIVLVDFYASWCGPCKSLVPTLEAIEKANGDVKVVKINVDENVDLAIKFNVGSIPMLAFVKNGKQETTLMGLHSEKKIQETIDSIKR